MGTEYYIDPNLKQIMQISIFMYFLLAIIFLIKNKESFLLSGLFLASADTRYFSLYSLYSINIIYYFLIIWSITLLLVYKRKRKNKLYTIFKKLRFNNLYIAFIWIFFISLLFRGINCIVPYLLVFYSSIVLLYFFAVNKDRIDYRKTDEFLLGIQLGFLLQIILMFIFSPGEVTGRLGDISVSADMVGINAGMSIMISTYFLMSGKKNVVTLYHITIVFFMSYAIYLTQSRAPLFATAIVIVFVFIFYKSNIPKVGIRLIKPLLIILSIGGVYWLFNNLTEIFFTRNIILGDNIFDTFVKQTTISRIRPMQMVISTSSNFEFINIWFGKGIGYWRDVSRRWGMLRIETFWHESFYELGIIGTLLLFFGYFKIFLFCLKKYFYSYSRNSLMYIMLFLFTLLMSPFSFGWLLYGTPGFIYAFILGSSIISKSTVRSRI